MFVSFNSKQKLFQSFIRLPCSVAKELPTSFAYTLYSHWSDETPEKTIFGVRRLCRHADAVDRDFDYHVTMHAYPTFTAPFSILGKIEYVRRFDLFEVIFKLTESE